MFRLLLLLLCLCIGNALRADSHSNLTPELLNDHARVLSPGMAREIRALLRNARLDYGLQITVVTLPRPPTRRGVRLWADQGAQYLFDHLELRATDKRNAILLALFTDYGNIRVVLGANYENRSWSEDYSREKTIREALRDQGANAALMQGVKTVIQDIAAPHAAKGLPPPVRIPDLQDAPVMDEANILPSSLETTLKAKIQQLEAHNITLSVLTMKRSILSRIGIPDEEILRQRVAQRFPIPQRQRRNIALLVSAPDHFATLYLGPGFPKALHSRASEILDETIRPTLARHDVKRGVFEGVEQLVQDVGLALVELEAEPPKLIGSPQTPETLNALAAGARPDAGRRRR